MQHCVLLEGTGYGLPTSTNKVISMDEIGLNMYWLPVNQLSVPPHLSLSDFIITNGQLFACCTKSKKFDFGDS